MRKKSWVIMLYNKSCFPSAQLTALCRRSWSHCDHEKQIMKEIQFKYLLFMFRLNFSMAINCRKFRLYYARCFPIFASSLSRIFVQIFHGKNSSNLKLDWWGNKFQTRRFSRKDFTLKQRLSGMENQFLFRW